MHLSWRHIHLTIPKIATTLFYKSVMLRCLSSPLLLRQCSLAHPSSLAFSQSKPSIHPHPSLLPLLFHFNSFFDFPSISLLHIALSSLLLLCVWLGMFAKCLLPWLKLPFRCIRSRKTAEETQRLHPRRPPPRHAPLRPVCSSNTARRPTG